MAQRYGNKRRGVKFTPPFLYIIFANVTNFCSSLIKILDIYMQYLNLLLSFIIYYLFSNSLSNVDCSAKISSAWSCVK